MSARLLLVVVFTAGLLTASPSAEAQPSERMWRIGVLATGTPASTSTRFEIFRQALQDLGYVEGRNLTIETRWSDGTPERLSDDAAKLVAQKVDVILGSSPGALAARKVTRTIPIVFVTAADPVGSELVASIARPGGNVTGISLLSPEIVARQM